MSLTYNPSGFCQATTEYKLYEILEKRNQGLRDARKRFTFEPGCIIDYFGIDPKTNKPLLFEVKNWFLKIQDMEQLMKYLVHATERYGENNFKLILIAGGIEEPRRKILSKLGIEVFLTKDLV